jgi:tetratricopeptide (TPR) repeat protein
MYDDLYKKRKQIKYDSGDIERDLFSNDSGNYPTERTVILGPPPGCRSCIEKTVDTISEGLKTLYERSLMEAKTLFKKASKTVSCPNCYNGKAHGQAAAIFSDYLVQVRILEWEAEEHPDQLDKALKTCEKAIERAKKIGDYNYELSRHVQEIFLGEEAAILFEGYSEWMNAWAFSYQSNPQEAEQYLDKGLKLLRDAIEKLNRSNLSQEGVRYFRAHENLSLAMKSLWHNKDKESAVEELKNAATLFESSGNEYASKFLKEQLAQFESGNLFKSHPSANFSYII